MFFKILRIIKENLLIFLILEIFFSIAVGGFLIKDVKIKEVIKGLILPVVYIMLIPSMMCLDFKKIYNIKKQKLIFLVMFINFIFYPVIAYIIYCFTNNFSLFVVLLLMSLLPTGSMTLNFVNILNGNLQIAATIQILCLTIGSFLVPLIIPMVISKHIEINSLEIFYKVLIVIFIPLIISQILRFLLSDKFVSDHKDNIKLIGIFGMILIVFISTFLKSDFIISHLNEILINFVLMLLFYSISLSIGLLGKLFFKDPKDQIAFFYTTFSKNLSISLSLCVFLFPESVIYLVIAYLIQLPLGIFIMCNSNDNNGIMSLEKNFMSKQKSI